MERKEIYDKWWEITYEGQGGKIKPIATKGVIEKLNKINDVNFEAYVSWQDDFLKGNKPSSLDSYRSAILHFLISKEINNLPLNLVDVKMIEDYVLSLSSSPLSKSQYRNKINYLKNFFRFLSDRNIALIEFDADSYMTYGEYYEDNDDGPVKTLEPKQVTYFRKHLLHEIDNYSENRELLYVFDMKYYTDYIDSKIQSLSLAKNVDTEKCLITFGNKVQAVPQNVIDNIVQLHKLGRLGSLNSIGWYMSRIKTIFEQVGVENLRPKDIKASWKRLSLKCPVCEREFEGTINNWCGVDYFHNGEIWIVCRECGNA